MWSLILHIDEPSAYGCSLLFQKSLNSHFSLIIFPFSKMSPSDIAFGINQIFCWPVLIVICVPSGIIVILWYWIVDIVLLNSIEDIISILFKLKLWSMHANNYKSPILVL